MASDKVPEKLIRINSRRNSFQQDEDMSIGMENVVVNKVNILNYKTFNQIILAQVPKAVIRP